jgi:heme oxygenase
MVDTLRRPREGAAALDALRRGTRDAHAALEATLDVAAPGAGRADYARHVAALGSWLAPRDAALWRGEWPAGIEASARAVKGDWVRADVRIARAEGFLDAWPAADDPRLPATSAGRFGLAYVIEGATLGGAVLRRRLAPALAPWPLRFLHGYGRRTGRRWTTFLDALDASVRTPAAIDEAAAAAADAFASLASWMRRHDAARAP